MKVDARVLDINYIMVSLCLYTIAHSPVKRLMKNLDHPCIRTPCGSSFILVHAISNLELINLVQKHPPTFYICLSALSLPP